MSDSGNEPSSGRPGPLVRFYRLVPGTVFPQRADRSAIGTIPTRAFRYCEALVTASAFGYYVFPPIDFTLVWDGRGVQWTWKGAGEWHPLTVAQFPDFVPYFDDLAPEEIKGFSPPFLGAMQEPGIVQIWSGFVARTAPGTSLLIRPLANVPQPRGYEMFEGIIESDRWFGPLFTNIRLLKTDEPIAFKAEHPLFQVQPIPREAYDDRRLNDIELVGAATDFAPEDWDDYFETVVRPNVQTDRPRGAYAVAARKRRKGEDGA